MRKNRSVQLSLFLLLLLQLHTIMPAQTPGGRKENLGPNVNSRWDERAPVISPDGRTLYFTRGFHPENTGYGYFDAEQDIWYSTLKTDSSWSPAKNMGAPLNTIYPNSVCSVSPDGNTLLLLGAYNEDGTSDAGYSISHRTRTGWSYPQKLNIRNYYNRSRYAIAYLDNNGAILLLAAERANSTGKKDLFICFNEGGNNWSEPENLGPEINTPDEEYSPFLASDGRTLYFSSMGYGGMGGYDVFVSRKLDETWKHWSKPENLGSSINSTEDDLFFKIPSKGDYVYFLSYSDSYGMGDIFRILLPEKLRPDPVVMVKGKVIAAFTDEPLDAVIHYESLPDYREIGTAVTDPATGDYKIALPAGKKYRFYASADDYIAHGGEIDLTGSSGYREVDSNIVLSPIEIGQVLTLDDIYFGQNSSTIPDQYLYVLDNIILFLNGNPSASLQVVGCKCDDEKNPIDKERAEFVSEEIIKRFISGKRLAIKRKGTCDSSSNKSCSRVEFIIINK